MSLSAATRIALESSEMVRVVTESASGLPVGGFEPVRVDPAAVQTDNCPIVVARVNANEPIWRFKSEMMAMVRSVEQQYWNLAQAHAALGISEQVVKMTREVLERELGELWTCHGAVADVAEVAQRLEQMKHDVVTKRSDVITTERQFRTILGLAPADNRRIVPTTKPTQ